jgi:hypothetical protein
LEFFILKGRASGSDFNFIIQKMQTISGRLALASLVFTSITFRMFGSLKAFVTSLTKQPGISYGRMLTTLELIWWVLQNISCPNKKMGALDIHTTRYANSLLIGKS